MFLSHYIMGYPPTVTQGNGWIVCVCVHAVADAVDEERGCQPAVPPSGL